MYIYNIYIYIRYIHHIDMYKCRIDTFILWTFWNPNDRPASEGLTDKMNSFLEWIAQALLMKRAGDKGIKMEVSKRKAATKVYIHG